MLSCPNLGICWLLAVFCHTGQSFQLSTNDDCTKTHGCEAAEYGLTLDCGSSGTSMILVSTISGCDLQCANIVTNIKEMGEYYMWQGKDKSGTELTCGKGKLCPTMVKVPSDLQSRTKPVYAGQPCGVPCKPDDATHDHWTEFMKAPKTVYNTLGNLLTLKPAISATAGNRVYNSDTDSKAFVGLRAKWNQALDKTQHVMEDNGSTIPGTHEALSEFADRTLSIVAPSKTYEASGIISMGGASAQLAWVLGPATTGAFDTAQAMLKQIPKEALACGTEKEVEHFWHRLGGKNRNDETYVPLKITEGEVIDRLFTMGKLSAGQRDAAKDHGIALISFLASNRDTHANTTSGTDIYHVQCEPAAVTVDGKALQSHVLGGMDQTLGQTGWKKTDTAATGTASGFYLWMKTTSGLTSTDENKELVGYCHSCLANAEDLSSGAAACLDMSATFKDTLFYKCSRCLKEYMKTDVMYHLLSTVVKPSVDGLFQAAAQVQGASERALDSTQETTDMPSTSVDHYVLQMSRGERATLNLKKRCIEPESDFRGFWGFVYTYCFFSATGISVIVDPANSVEVAIGAVSLVNNKALYATPTKYQTAQIMAVGLKTEDKTAAVSGIADLKTQLAAKVAEEEKRQGEQTRIAGELAKLKYGGVENVETTALYATFWVQCPKCGEWYESHDKSKVKPSEAKQS